MCTHRDRHRHTHTLSVCVFVYTHRSIDTYMYIQRFGSAGDMQKAGGDKRPRMSVEYRVTPQLTIIIAKKRVNKRAIWSSGFWNERVLQTLGMRYRSHITSVRRWCRIPRIIVLADSCIPVLGAALAAWYLAAFFHGEFRPPFGIASEKGLQVPRAASVVVHDGVTPVFRSAHDISQVWHLQT